MAIGNSQLGLGSEENLKVEISTFNNCISLSIQPSEKSSWAIMIKIIYYKTRKSLSIRSSNSNKSYVIYELIFNHQCFSDFNLSYPLIAHTSEIQLGTKKSDDTFKDIIDKTLLYKESISNKLEEVLVKSRSGEYEFLEYFNSLSIQSDTETYLDVEAIFWITLLFYEHGSLDILSPKLACLLYKSLASHLNSELYIRSSVIKSLQNVILEMKIPSDVVSMKIKGLMETILLDPIRFTKELELLFLDLIDIVRLQDAISNKLGKDVLRELGFNPDDYDITCKITRK